MKQCLLIAVKRKHWFLVIIDTPANVLSDDDNMGNQGSNNSNAGDDNDNKGDQGNNNSSDGMASDNGDAEENARYYREKLT